MSKNPTSPFMYGYFKWVSILSLVIITLYSATTLYSAYLLVNPPFVTIDDFSYGDVESGMVKLTLAEDNRYILDNITAENFDEKRDYLFKIVMADQATQSPARVWKSLAYLGLYVLVLFMHYRKWKGSYVPERENKFDDGKK